MKFRAIFLFLLVFVKVGFCAEKIPKIDSEINARLKWDLNWCWMDTTLQILATIDPITRMVSTWYEKYSMKEPKPGSTDFESLHGQKFVNVDASKNINQNQSLFDIQKEIDATFQSISKLQKQGEVGSDKYKIFFEQWQKKLKQRDELKKNLGQSDQKYYLKENLQPNPSEIIGQFSKLMYRMTVAKERDPIYPKQFYDSLFLEFEPGRPILQKSKRGSMYNPGSFMNTFMQLLYKPVDVPGIFDFSTMLKNNIGFKKFYTGTKEYKVLPSIMPSQSESLEVSINERIKIEQFGSKIVVLKPILFVDLLSKTYQRVPSATFPFFKTRVDEQISIFKNYNEANLGESGQKKLYRLLGVAFVHAGSHYKALVRQKDGEWYLYNDMPPENPTVDRISQEKLKEILGSNLISGTHFEGKFFCYEQVFNPTEQVSQGGENQLKINRGLYNDGADNWASSVIQVLAEIDEVVPALKRGIRLDDVFSAKYKLLELIKNLKNPVFLLEANQITFMHPSVDFISSWKGYKGPDSQPFLKSMLSDIFNISDDTYLFSRFTENKVSSPQYLWEGASLDVQKWLDKVLNAKKKSNASLKYSPGKYAFIHVAEKKEGKVLSTLLMPTKISLKRKKEYELFAIIGLNKGSHSFNVSVKKSLKDWYFYSHLFQNVQKYSEQGIKDLLEKNSGIYGSRAHVLFYRKTEKETKVDVDGVRAALERLKAQLSKLHGRLKGLG